MVPRYVAAVSLSLGLATSGAGAQTTRTDQLVDAKLAKAAAISPETREKGDRVITRLEHLFMPEPPAIRLTFGDFRPAAGLAAGIGAVVPIGERGAWNTSTARSIKNFTQVESSLDLVPLTTDRLHLRPFVKWENAPDLPFFGVGRATSRSTDVSYGLRSAEAGAGVDMRAGRWFGYGGSAGYLDVRAGDGTGSQPAPGSLPAAEAPGNGASLAWWHTTVYAGFDSRESPGYTDAGALYRVTFHEYADRGAAFGFSRTDIDLRQFVPILHDNWVIALQARGDFTSPAAGQSVPFFMLPSLGGRDTLRSYADYRFTDRHSLLLRSELRWTASPVVDMALFLDQGTVAPTLSTLDLHDLNRSWGLGARFHAPTFTALRLEAARGDEGWRYTIAHSASF